MENQKFVDSIVKEIVQPGVEQLINNRFFTELRKGKLSQKRLKGFALQHYHCNHAINKGLAFCMVRNANNPPIYNQFQELFTEEQSTCGSLGSTPDTPMTKPGASSSEAQCSLF